MENPAAERGPTTPPAGSPLMRRIVTSGGIVMGGFGVGQVLRIISNLILTRLLAPEAFGLMAVAISINIWAVMLTDIGVTSSVIRSRNSEDPEFVRTAWTTALLRNLFVWVIIIAAGGGVFLLAGAEIMPSDSVFADPVLPLIMIAMGLQLPVEGLASMNSALASRRLAMKRIVALEITRQLFTMLVTIIFAWLGFSVWALVIGTIAGAAFNTILSHFVFPGPSMGLRMVRTHFDEIFNFGKWLIIASFFGFIVNRGDQLLFGWALDKESFSLYAVASIWIAAAITLIQTVLNRIYYPAFSEVLRTDPEALTGLYRKTRAPLDAFVVAAAFGAFFLAEPVFSFIYPNDYSGVGYYVKLLAPALLFLPYRLINVAALASGDSKGFTWVTVVSGSAMIILTPLAFRFLGATPAILLFACIALFALPSSWRIGRRVMTLDPIVEGRLIVAAAVLAAMLLATATT